MTDAELVACFEAAEEPPGGFHHAQHVRVAWFYLRRDPWLTALDRFRSGLRRFADARGKPGLYHETITVAFVALIGERLDICGADPPWDEFAARNADLLSWKPSILDRYYRPETLASDRARRVFVLPDTGRFNYPPHR
jgi:hypothetical protein